MKVLVIEGERQIAVAEREKPQAQAGEILLKIHYTGFCGSDLNTFLGKNPMVQLPVVPGHEIGAEIVEVTAGVPGNLRPGMYCTVNPYTSCGHCSSCRNSRPNACRFNQTMGVQRDGAMGEYIAVPWQKVVTGENLGARDFALVEPLSVGFHAVDRGRVSDSDQVMVIGCGMIGIGAIARSALRGAEVIAVDVDDEKLQLARQSGAGHTINSQTDDLHQRLSEITGGNGPDVVIEAVGSPVTYRTAIDEAAFTGRVVCIGYAKTETAFETKFFVMKELDIRGSRNALPEDFRAVMHYMKQHPGIAERFITGIYPPEQASEALNQWAGAPGKVFRILIGF
jgi:2-desacetyl-2-hydroxyethyl bacteriochlorophyllide A dehydrogenase